MKAQFSFFDRKSLVVFSRLLTHFGHFWIKSDLLVGSKSRATPRRAAEPTMGGLGETQGTHRYGVWSGRPLAGVTLGYILGRGDFLEFTPPPPL